MSIARFEIYDNIGSMYEICSYYDNGVIMNELCSYISYMTFIMIPNRRNHHGGEGQQQVLPGQQSNCQPAPALGAEGGSQAGKAPAWGSAGWGNRGRVIHVADWSHHPYPCPLTHRQSNSAISRPQLSSLEWFWNRQNIGVVDARWTFEIKLTLAAHIWNQIHICRTHLKSNSHLLHTFEIKLTFAAHIWNHWTSFSFFSDALSIFIGYLHHLLDLPFPDWDRAGGRRRRCWGLFSKGEYQIITFYILHSHPYPYPYLQAQLGITAGGQEGFNPPDLGKEKSLKQPDLP